MRGYDCDLCGRYFNERPVMMVKVRTGILHRRTIRLCEECAKEAINTAHEEKLIVRDTVAMDMSLRHYSIADTLIRVLSRKPRDEEDTEGSTL